MDITDAFDAARDRFDDIVGRMRYHTTGQSPDNWGDLCFYTQQLEIDLAAALAQELTYRVDETLTGHLKSKEIITEPGAGLVQPVEFKIILPEPLVPMYRAFITEITPEDLKLWNSG